MAALKLLCVDDEPDLLEVLKSQLKESGLEVLTALSGEEALSIVEQRGSQMAGILSDLRMPGMSGLELRQKLLEKFAPIPFMVLSGNITRELALRAVELKISAFVDKPFDLKKLLNTVGAETRDRVASIREEEELLVGFVGEAEVLLEEIETLCLQLEDGGESDGIVNRIFACAHTIKGASGYFKPDTVHRFSHRFEDYLTRFKNGGTAISPEEVSVCLRAVDQLRELLGDLRETHPPARDLESLVEIFQQKGKAVTERKPAASAPSDVRVRISLLDEFMEKSGDITVLRSMINKTVHMIEREFPGHPQIAALTDLLGEMHRANGMMQDRVSDLRKVQLRQVMKPLQRTIRDLSLSLKKNLQFSVAGDELRVDYSVAEALNKCLIHLLRNAADHGIEDEEARRRAGKPAAGEIRITCETRGDFICVRLSDDGRGIDPVRIRTKAVEKGLISAAEAEGMSDNEIRLLIFHPGFSTAAAVTDVSGRGVGMDMVKGTIDAIGGRVDIESETGKGSSFLIKIPAPKSVVIIGSLLVRSAGHVLALPQEFIQRVLLASAKDSRIQKIKNRPFWQDDGHLLPIVSVQELLGGAPDLEKEAESFGLVMVRSRRGLFCLRTDEIHDFEDTVVKRLGGWMTQLPIYLGATFLADGRVGLILDVDGIAEAVGLAEKGMEAAPVAEPVKDGPQDGLLVIECGSQRFGLPQNTIFRLEEIDFQKAGTAARPKMIRYRDGILPILPLGDLLGMSSAEDLPYPHPVVVVEREGKPIGLSVKRICDLVSAPSEHGGLPAEFGRTQIIGEKIVVVLDVGRLWQKWDEMRGR